jgi:hypothetical protein
MLNAAERKLEIEMLEHPLRWPLWPVLPVKHPDGRVGVVTADYPTIVLKQRPTTSGILLQLACEESGMPALGRPDEVHHEAQDSEGRAAYEEQIEARYQDIDGLLDAGWRID